MPIGARNSRFQSVCTKFELKSDERKESVWHQNLTDIMFHVAMVTLRREWHLGAEPNMSYAMMPYAIIHSLPEHQYWDDICDTQTQNIEFTDAGP